MPKSVQNRYEIDSRMGPVSRPICRRSDAAMEYLLIFHNKPLIFHHRSNSVLLELLRRFLANNGFARNGMLEYWSPGVLGYSS